MKRYKNKGSTISVYLEQEIIDKLDKVAEELNESRSYVIRSIILNATGGKQNEKHYTPCNWGFSYVSTSYDGCDIYYYLHSNG